tara:strand:+ start:450 stop:845 length:396 start_codon:yes stop_codon:yes gene_type:complete
MNGLDSSIVKNKCQLYGLVTLRVLIGWHFLYEGVSKLTNPYWSSAAYLLDSKWLFSGLAETIVSDPVLLSISDYVNMWGLTLVGASLLLGLFSRYTALIGMGFVYFILFICTSFIGFGIFQAGRGELFNCK